jgi:hypothetical protein
VKEMICAIPLTLPSPPRGRVDNFILELPQNPFPPRGEENIETEKNPSPLRGEGKGGGDLSDYFKASEGFMTRRPMTSG